MKLTTPREPIHCRYCERVIAQRPGQPRYSFRWADGRYRVHKRCLHRLTAPDNCVCDICTGDIH